MKRTFTSRLVATLRLPMFAVVMATASCSANDGTPNVPAPTIHAYAAPALGTEGAVNTYWIETQHGVIVIDGLRTIPDAQAAIVELQKIGKPVEAIFITHPHPDHNGGVGTFAQTTPGVPIYATKACDDELGSDSQGEAAKAKSSEGAGFPDVLTRATTIISDGQHLTIDGLELVIHERGPAEAISATTYEVPALSATFAGDIVANDMKAALFEGRSAKWLTQLDGLRSDVSGGTTLYPGHGQAGPAMPLIDDEKNYIEAFRQLVLDNRLPDKTVDDAGKQRIGAAMEAKFPNRPQVAAKFPGFLGANVDAVATELAATP